MRSDRILLYAFHDAGRAVLEALLADQWPVVGLFTHEADAGESWFRPPEALARASGVPVFFARSPNRPRWVEVARALQPTVVLSVMYRRLLGPALLALPPLGAYNLHPSLLPRLRGRAPVNWALVQEERETGVTLHRMTAAADAGDIVAQAAISIAPRETALTLHRRLVPLFRALARTWLPRIVAGTAPLHPQDPTAATTFGKRGPADGSVDWHASAARVDALVRAVTRPYPGAVATFDGRPLFVWRVAPRAAGGAGPPGTTRLLNGRPVVSTGQGEVVLLDWQIGPEDDPAARRALLARAERDELVLG